VQPGVRESIALTYELERLWKLSAAATSDKSAHVAKVSDYALKRYVGTREGVYRVYPAVRVATKFDPTKRPWSVVIDCNQEFITITIHLKVARKHQMAKLFRVQCAKLL